MRILLIFSRERERVLERGRERERERRLKEVIKFFLENEYFIEISF